MVQFLPLIISAASRMGQAQDQRQHRIDQALTLSDTPNKYQVDRASRSLPGLVDMGQSLGWGRQSNPMNWDSI